MIILIRTPVNKGSSVFSLWKVVLRFRLKQQEYEGLKSLSVGGDGGVHPVEATSAGERGGVEEENLRDLKLKHVL